MSDREFSGLESLLHIPEDREISSTLSWEHLQQMWNELRIRANDISLTDTGYMVKVDGNLVALVKVYNGMPYVIGQVTKEQLKAYNLELYVKIFGGDMSPMIGGQSQITGREPQLGGNRKE